MSQQENAYIPFDLDDAVRHLSENVIDPADIEMLRDPDASAKNAHLDHWLHMGLGKYIRNSWGLWGGSRLRDWFFERGLHHPDDMSSVILSCMVARLRGESFDFESEVAGYEGYWRTLAEASEPREVAPGIILEIKTIKAFSNRDPGDETD